jgi:hypothetical protein
MKAVVETTYGTVGRVASLSAREWVQTEDRVALPEIYRFSREDVQD